MTDGPQYQGAVGAVEEPQGDQFVPQPLVVADGGGGVPGFGAHGGVQAGVLGAQRDGAGFAAGDLVGQDQLEEARWWSRSRSSCCSACSARARQVSARAWRACSWAARAAAWA